MTSKSTWRGLRTETAWAWLATIVLIAGQLMCGTTPAPNAVVAGACAIVDTAKEACTVIRYLDATGKEAEVRVSREELREFGREAATRHAAAAASGSAK